MRVIGGEFRSRKLRSLPGLDIRPTPDRLRETLFDILAPRIGGTVFVDAYAGTGAVGIEALSRGALRAVFLEKNRHAVELIRQNLKSLGLEDRGQVVQGSVLLMLPASPGDIVFIDPPYEQERQYEIALAALSAHPPQLAIVQHSKYFDLADNYGALHRARTLRQGDNVLSIYST